MRDLRPAVLAALLCLQPAAPAIAQAAPPPAVDWPAAALDAAVVTAVSAGVLALALSPAGSQALERAGASGGPAFLVAVALVPPGTLMAYREPAAGTYLPALGGGLLGLGLGFALGRAAQAGGLPSWSAPAGLALGQGLGAGLAYQLYQAYRPLTPNLDRLPPVEADPDPYKLWDRRRQRDRETR